MDYAASVPMYPPCNVRYNEDEEITDTPIRIHVGEIDTYSPTDACIKYVELLSSKGKDIKIKVYAKAHHGFDANPSSMFQGKTKMTFKDFGYGKCYFEENTDSSIINEENLGAGFHQQITQVGINEFLNSATEKKRKNRRPGKENAARASAARAAIGPSTEEEPSASTADTGSRTNPTASRIPRKWKKGSWSPWMTANGAP